MKTSLREQTTLEEVLGVKEPRRQVWITRILKAFASSSGRSPGFVSIYESEEAIPQRTDHYSRGALLQ